MKDSVAMFTKVGNDEVALGHCHPAQARLLVKQELASWQDGKIYLILRHAYAEILDNSANAWVGPKDDGNVSYQEKERRQAWFRAMLPKVALATAASSSKEPRFVSQQMTAADQRKMAQDYLKVACAEDDEISQAEADVFFQDHPLPYADENLESLWDSKASNRNMVPDDPHPEYYTKDPAMDSLAYEQTLDDSFEVTSEAPPMSVMDGIWDSAPDTQEWFTGLKETRKRRIDVPLHEVEPQNLMLIPVKFSVSDIRRIDLEKAPVEVPDLLNEPAPQRSSLFVEETLRIKD